MHPHDRALLLLWSPASLRAVDGTNDETSSLLERRVGCREHVLWEIPSSYNCSQQGAGSPCATNPTQLLFLASLEAADHCVVPPGCQGRAASLQAGAASLCIIALVLQGA